MQIGAIAEAAGRGKPLRMEVRATGFKLAPCSCAASRGTTSPSTHSRRPGLSARLAASLIGPLCQEIDSPAWHRAGSVLVQVTLLYAVSWALTLGAARIGKTERRAMLLGAL
jgi:hypothetical protein